MKLTEYLRERCIETSGTDDSDGDQAVKGTR